MKLRVLSYNIHKGFSMGNRNFVLSRIREAIESVHADLVFLQEVLGKHSGHEKKFNDWPILPQFEYLAGELWPHYAYGKNAVYTSGHHGNAILSKYPLTFWENIDISTNRYEKRGLLHGVLQVPHREKPIHAICVHLGLIEAERSDQVNRLCDRIDTVIPHDEPLLIAGDFNDWRLKVTKPLQEKVEVREVFDALHGSHPRTFPSWMPFLKLDRIYFRNLNPVSALSFTGKPWNELSDHTALYSEFNI